MKFKGLINLSPILFWPIALVACGGGGGGTNTSAPNPNLWSTPGLAELVQASGSAATNLTCKDWDMYTHTPALGRLDNNVWNAGASGGYLHKQCITMRGPSTNKQFGWSWDWPSSSSTVFAFPEVRFGWTPWGYIPPNPNEGTRLPIKISSITRFIFNYSVTVSSNGHQNTATAMWLTHSGTTGSTAHVYDIATEFMIWSDGYGVMRPSGIQQPGLTTINGTDFEVWFNPNQIDASGANPTAVWNYVAYRMVSPQQNVSLDIKQILNDAALRGLISTSDYVSNVELGNEINSGQGQTWLNSVSLDIQ